MTSVLEILSLQELYTRKENLLKQLKKVDFEIISRKNEQIIINDSQEVSLDLQSEKEELLEEKEEDSFEPQPEKEVILEQKETKETPFIPVLHQLINKNISQELPINNINVKIKIKKVQKVQNNQDSSILNCDKEEKLIKKIIIKKKS